MNKNSGYILATKTLRTNRIVRIINHKTHIKRTNNTLYKRLYECKRRVRITDRKPRMPILQGFPRSLYACWLYFGSISPMEYYFQSNIERLLQYSQKRRFHIFYRLWFLHNRWNKSRSVHL